MISNIDEDVIKACADLVGRTGATQFQIGYTHEGVPVEEAGWYAHAQLRGARITEQDHRSPDAAAEALCRRLLNGGQCQHCKGVVTLSDDGARLFNSTLANGTSWSIEDQRTAGVCRWRRMGARWVRGCEPDGLAATIEHALRDGQVEQVPHLLMVLAVQDPDRAQTILDAVEGGLRLTRQQRRNLKRGVRRGER